MQIVKADCPSCGSPLAIPDDRDTLYCSSCGSSLAIERGETSVTLKFAEKLASAIEQSGNATQEAIRENAYATRSELQRLEASQELAALQSQLANLQAEMRMVERGPNSPTASMQLLRLHQSEYQLLERLYAHHKRFSMPDPANLPASIDFGNWEISWLGAEISALSSSNHPGRSNLIQSLYTRRSELASKAAELKMAQMRNRFPSCGRPDPSPSDPEGLVTFLQLIVADEQNARPFRSSPEGQDVYNEIVARQKRLKSWLVQGDRKRIGEMLMSTRFRANADDLSSLHDLLGLVDRDLQNDFGKYETGVAQEYQKALVSRKTQITKQINKLEYRKQTGRDPGLLAAVIAAISAGLAGLAMVLGRALHRSSQAHAPSPPVPSESTSGQTARPARSTTVSLVETRAVASNIEPASGLPSILARQPLNVSDFSSNGLGCLLGLVIWLVISFIGLLALMGFGLMSAAKELSPWTVSIVFLFSSIGFVLGAIVFLRITAPSISIIGTGPLPTVCINPKRAGKGILNSMVIKTYVGLITCIAIYLIFLTLVFLTTSLSIGLSAVLFLLGIALGPIIAVLVAKRTAIS